MTLADLVYRVYVLCFYCSLNFKLFALGPISIPRGSRGGEETKGVITIHKPDEDRQRKSQPDKNKQRSTKHYTEH
jgi:hypothetical protein